MAVQIVAEIGVNHQNDLGIARQLIEEAKNAGADAAKFQASTVTEEVSITAAPDHFAELRQVVPTFEFVAACKAICEEVGIEFLCTPSGEESLAFLVTLGVKRLKVASDNLTNIPFLRAVARTHKPVILSTGMGDISEVNKATTELASRTHRLVLLHCVSAYPCPDDQLNIRAMQMLQAMGYIGLSDHTTSTLLPAVAVGAGAKMIEKHLTLSNKMPGPDHAASLEPGQFAQMVANIRAAEAGMGGGSKRPQPAEQEGLKLYRKSLVASRPIKSGDLFTMDNVTTKRPGIGIPASEWDRTVNVRYATRDYQPDELI